MITGNQSTKNINKRKGTAKQPLKKGVANVPVIMQMEAPECGAACVAMILAYYGKWLPLDQVRLDCGVSRDGSSMKNMFKAAIHYGLEVHGFSMGVETLKNEGTFPCIIHWNFNHFVVVNGFKRGKVVINDPARGTVSVTMEEFDRCMTGPCLLFAPGENFVPSGQRASTLTFVKKRLKGAAAAVAFITITTVITYLFRIVNPVLSRIFYDHLLTGLAPSWFYPFIVIAAAVAFLQLITAWARTVYSLKLNGKMAIEGNTSYVWKILHLPMAFFSQRMAGDILQRKNAHASIAGMLVQTLGPLAIDTVMMLFYLIVMLRYSPLMTLIGILSLVFNLFAARYISRKRVNLTRAQLRDKANLASATLTGITMTETIKAAGAEAGFFRKWSGYHALVNADLVEGAEMNAKFAVFPKLVSIVSNYFILFLGIYLAMNGEFTLGLIATFQGLLRAFMGPAKTLVDAGQTIQEMRSSMERVEDVMEHPDDPFTTENTEENGPFDKLSGEVELKDVSFGYSPLAEPIIKNFSMKVKAGDRVAIVGTSGCGKSTIAKLISALYEPWSGEILFDGKPIKEIPGPVFRSSVAMVEQQIVLFEDTIANNIRMWDNTIEDHEVIRAAKDAQIHEDIAKRPGGYQGTLIENGKDLSGGQRQRLEIARVLALDPRIIILDEATSALDAKTEFDVVKAINDRGITCIVVAHRLSTIRDCDEIIVLDHGEIAERGTHEELFLKGGIYTELVTNE